MENRFHTTGDYLLDTRLKRGVNMKECQTGSRKYAAWLSYKYAIIGWIGGILLFLGNLRRLSDLWDSLVSFWGKINAMQPFLKVCTEYAESPVAQLILTVLGFLGIAVAAHFGAKRRGLPTVSVPPPATKPAAPPSNPPSGTAKASAARIMEQISQIKSPMEQKEFAKTCTGRRVKWILSMVNVSTFTAETFTLTLKETNIPSFELMCLISVDLPVEGNDYLRKLEKR